MSRSARRQRRAQPHRPPGLDPALRRLIDALTADPALRRLLYQAMQAIDSPAALEAYAGPPAGQKAAFLLALRDAVAALTARKPCDFCPVPAATIQFVLVRPDENFRNVQRPGTSNALSGFLLLCPRCVRLGEPELKRRMLDQFAQFPHENGPGPYRREAILGPGVGEVEHLPPHCALEMRSSFSAGPAPRKPLRPAAWSAYW
jgi:hypothetical protein